LKKSSEVLQREVFAIVQLLPLGVRMFDVGKGHDGGKISPKSPESDAHLLAKKETRGRLRPYETEKGRLHVGSGNSAKHPLGGIFDISNDGNPTVEEIQHDTLMRGPPLKIGDARPEHPQEHVRNRVAQWEGSGNISAKTAERYRELIENQIVPHLGEKQVQKLKPADIEAWHAHLKGSGRKDGKGGISNRTIGHAHWVLSKALREAARHDLVVKNVAAEETAPKVEGEEMIIFSAEQLAELPGKLACHPLLPRAITAVYTGIRRGELLAARWCNVDLDTKVIRIREAINADAV
jgi:hypothetical protein